METLHPGVYTVELPSAVRPIEGVSTSTAAFLGFASKGPIPGTKLPNGHAAQPLLVTSFTEYQRNFGGFRADSFLTYSARAFFENGGQRLYVIRVVGTPASPPGSPPSLAATRASSPAGAPFGISAANEGVWGNQITVSVANSSDGNTTNNFKLVVSYDSGAGPEIVETYDNVTWSGSPTSGTGSTPADYARTVVNRRSEYIAILGPDFTSRPANQTIALSGGNDGPLPQTTDLIGQEAADNTVSGTGLHALDKITDVNLIAIPGNGDPATVEAGMSYCKTRKLQDCFFIGDIGTINSVPAARQQGQQPDLNTISDARNFSVNFPGRSFGDYGAVYFPYVLTDDPLGTGRNPTILLPPSPFMAGVYARIDNSRGVFKAPAGLEAGIAGAVGLASAISDTEQDQLNPVGVNAIRAIPGAGIVSWGTRTIGSDPSWRYIPVRRIAIFLRVSIYNGIQFAVFEPRLLASLPVVVLRPMKRAMSASSLLSRTSPNVKKFFLPMLKANSRTALPKICARLPWRYRSVSILKPSIS